MPAPATPRPDGSKGGGWYTDDWQLRPEGLALRVGPRQPLLNAPSRMSVIPAADTSPAAWRVVFACFVAAVFAWGFGFYAHGIYLVELQRAHGWSTGFISSVVTAHYVLGALLLPRIAEAIGRFRPSHGVPGRPLNHRCLPVPAAIGHRAVATRLALHRHGAGLERNQRRTDRRNGRGNGSTVNAASPSIWR